MAKKKEKLKLTRAEKKQLQELMTRSQQQNAKKVPRTAQATIPYQRMWPDGICRVTDNYYTKTIQFQDINYQLAQNDDKTSIFEGWCDFLNYFDASIHLQLSFLNLTASAESFEQSIIIPDKDDGFNDVRHEYAEMLQNQLAKGNNGLTKTKFITYGIEAENFKTAKPRLERIEIDLLNNFKRLGVAASPLDGRERLKLMHDMFHMDTQAPFQFDWKWLAPTGLSTKDFIAPASFDFRAKNTFGMGSKQGEVSFFSILAADLNDRCLADFLAMESSLIVSLHIQAIDQVAAIKDVKRKITDLDKMKIEEQKKEITGEPKNLEEQAISLVGRDIYEKLVKGYTEKQWGRDCKELPAFIIKRLPVRLTFDNNYFNALYQGIPIGGYTKMVENLLDGIEVRLNTDYLEHKAELDALADKVVYTGPIDAYFGFKLGTLEYRSVRFENETLDIPNFQGNAAVNYTDRETPWTRIIEHKWFEFGKDEDGNDLPKTIISREYSSEWKAGDEPYYPVNDEKNGQLYAKYKDLADKETGVIFGGRLGEYKYYDMDTTIASVLDMCEKELG